MSSFRQSIVDLVVVLLLLGAADAVVLVFGGGSSPLRTALVLPVVLFLPGYALVSALYPDLPNADPQYREGSDDGWSLTGIERIGLAVAASLCLVPLIGLVSNFTRYGIRLRPVFAGVSVLTAVLTLVALVRRYRTEPERRFHLPLLAWFGGAGGRYFGGNSNRYSQQFAFEGRSRGQRALNLLLVVTVLVLVSSVAYAAVGPTLPSDDDSFTELYLLSENDSGELLAESYPRALDQGESAPLTVAIGNHEGSEQRYTVVIEAQQVTVESGERRIVSQTEIQRFRTTVPAGSTERVETQITAAESADRQRIAVLLFRGPVPDDPSSANAGRATRIWVSANGSQASTSDAGGT